MRIKKLGLLYRGIIFLFAGFLLLVIALLGRELLWKGETHQEPVLALLDAQQWEQLDTEIQGQRADRTECLLIYDQSPQSLQGEEMMRSALEQMKVGVRSMTQARFRPAYLTRYDTVVLDIADLSVLGEDLMDLMDWVKAGGHLMLLSLPTRDVYMELISKDLGITSMGERPSAVRGLRCTRPFMIGGDTDYFITDPYESSIDLLLDDQCEVYMESTGGDPIPLIWRRELGGGVVVVSNLGFYDKIYRGFYAAAYSLLDEGFAWPVINGSVFFLDDFPAPVPFGDDSYVTEDYGVSVGDFLVRYWWQDLKELAEKHGFSYTGMIIEQYSNVTKAPFERNLSVSRYDYFGYDLLSSGGELGFHGYNHMPLVPRDFKYERDFAEYVPWNSDADMAAGLEELNAFCTDLFKEDDFQVYVPPSNILSPEGRALIAARFPQIRAIASTYLEYLDSTGAYVQEFEVAEDGIVEMPRVISGCVFDEYTNLSAFMELNFHFVNTHFQHPDDVLDEDRGADLGWEEMFRRLSGYTDWLYAAAPTIRNMTASELAAAVQRYDAVTVRRTLEEDRMVLELGNFADEAWFLVRLNGHEPGAVEGGVLEEQLDGLYLLKAESSQVTIELK